MWGGGCRVCVCVCLPVVFQSDFNIPKNFKDHKAAM